VSSNPYLLDWGRIKVCFANGIGRVATNCLPAWSASSRGSDSMLKNLG
jgi:hypothetical protein